MFIPRVILRFLLLTLPVAVLGQNAAFNATPIATAGAEADSKAPKLEHFDPSLVDPALSPCDDFYTYACNNCLKANPIPPNQLFSSTCSTLDLWNENLLRETLEAS